MTRKARRLPPARSYAPGMGQAVADRTINRKVETRYVKPRWVTAEVARDDRFTWPQQLGMWAKDNGHLTELPGLLAPHEWKQLESDPTKEIKARVRVIGKTRRETWEEVADRVAFGSSLLEPREDHQIDERVRLHHHIRQASVLLSGRHLQHGDAEQPKRNQEVFTNCAVAPASYILFYLLLNGSGVGRCYDDDMMVVDWRQMPIVVPVIDYSHPDVGTGEINTLDRRNAEHLYAHKERVIFEVPDTREGWAAALEQVEIMTFEKQRDKVLILDFSKVRCKGSPIKGMQNRPSSGPGPLMEALRRIALIRESDMEPWRATMYVDHLAAECVLVGGARRSARMATKTWRDKSVLEFIKAKQGGFLWSANDSVTVDDEFHSYVQGDFLDTFSHIDQELAEHARKVFDLMTECAYHDGTGEPGIINQHKLVQNDKGFDGYKDGKFVGSRRFQIDERAVPLMKALAERVGEKWFKMIVNPCGEIALLILGGFCLVGDVVPYFAQDDDDAEDAFRAAARALIRTNLMDSIFGRETKRTNRIGVGITGFHEFALKRFGFGFRDLIDEEKSWGFWQLIGRFKRAVREEAVSYSALVGMPAPHTDTTIKPAGTTSKLFLLTEGVHLPAMREFLRWVQFRNDDPLVAKYEGLGYPVMRLKTYSGTTVVGFPTKPEICRLADELGLQDKIVTAAEATPEEQYRFLMLLEKYWIVGVEEDGVTPLPDTGNQVSYTLKYDPKKVSFEDFKKTIREYQHLVKACTVMPQSDTSAYEYQPEEPVTKARYDLIAAAIKRDQDGDLSEDVDFEHVDCASGACPIDFDKARDMGSS